jgi:4-amino-4-deoxy-L-arabinose transferase-like glycosyltransferase
MVADPKIDAVVTAFMAWAVYFFLRARRQPSSAIGAWLCIAGGFLTKGPIALAVPLLAIGPEWIRDREWRIRPLAGVAIVALAFAPYGIAAGPRLVYFHLWEQSFGRLTGQSTWRNTAGPLYFAHTALWAFLPFVPAVVLDLWTRLRAWARSRVLPPDPTRAALWWLLLPLIGISASRYKLPQYLYWLAPPAALLAARALRSAPRAAERALLAVGALLAAAAVALPFTVHRFVYPAPLAWVAVPIALLLALRPRSFAPLGIAALAGAMAFFHGALHPWALSFQPDRALAERARAEELQAAILPFIGVSPTNAAGFYARRAARPFDAAGLTALVAREGPRVAVAAPDSLPELRSRGLRAEVLLDLPSFVTSRPTAAFLLAATRPDAVGRALLVRLSAADAAAGRASSVPTRQ